MSLDKLLNKVASQGQDQTQAQTFEGGQPIAAGLTGARLVGYFEVGQHESTYKGETKTQNEVQLVFELIGNKHPPKDINGEKVPVRITATTNLSLNEKAWFYKWFSALRVDEKHFVQLLGKPLLLEIEHEEKIKDGQKRVYANIKKESLRKAIISVPSDPNDIGSELVEKPYPVGPALTELKAFVWEFSDPEMWDSIFIPGEYPERKDEKTGKVIRPAEPKNRLQLKIASALNFKGLPVYDYAAAKLAGNESVTKEGVEALDDAVGDVSNAAQDADDPMAGIE